MSQKQVAAMRMEAVVKEFNQELEVLVRKYESSLLEVLDAARAEGLKADYGSAYVAVVVNNKGPYCKMYPMSASARETIYYIKEVNEQPAGMTWFTPSGTS